jgi:hypothetical protein
MAIAGRLGAFKGRGLMMYPHSPSTWQLAVPGICFPQNMSLGQDALDQDWPNERFEPPRQRMPASIRAERTNRSSRGDGDGV